MSPRVPADSSAHAGQPQVSWRWPAAGLLLLACAVAATGWLIRSTESARPPDVFLLTVDTLRADHTSAYGYARQTTPWLEGLARDGVQYERCVASSSWTVPSLTTLHTGQHAWTLGMSTAPSLGGHPAKPDLEHPILPPRAVLLAERFKEAGYATYGLTANGHLARAYGWDRGFDFYAHVGWDTVDALERRLRTLMRVKAESDKPAFVWIHVFDPHDPYLRVPGDTWAKGARTYAEAHGDLSLTTPELEKRDDLKHGEGLALLQSMYDAEILDSDRWLSHAAARLGADDDAVVLFASDHGEEFQERGHFGHRVTLHEESVHVPCVLRAPGVAPRVESAPVGLIDLHETLLAAAGLDGAGVGRDVRHQVPAGPVFSQLMRGPVATWAVYDGAIKQIERGGEIWRYDLGADPGERHPLAGDPTLSAQIRALREAYPFGEPVMARSADAEALEALGYVDRDE